ncbi:exo-alpha-sialidase, partial [Actinoplanes sp. NPDC051633]
MTRRRRQILIAALVAALAVTTGATGLHLAGAEVPGARAAATGDGEMPSAAGAHLAALHQAQPNGGVLDSPGALGLGEFDERAYPANTISVAQVDRSRAAYASADRRAAPRGRAWQNRWTNIGPSEALYPFTEFRNAYNYVPNEYVAGGRTTSIALASGCRPGFCRAYITPAGGGVWATLDILAANPKWAYLGGPLGINAAGAVTVDRNDPTGLTIYVGTGEANICASGCVAGVGLYKSTNGGLTWEGPLGKNALSGKGIGDIIVKPGDRKTLYVATTTALRGMSSVCCSGITRPVPDAAKWGLYKSTDGGRNWAFVHNGSADATQCTGSTEEWTNNSAC